MATEQTRPPSDSESDNHADHPGPRHPYARGKLDPRLHALGTVFFPMDPGTKVPTMARTEETLRAPDDPILEAYLDAGHSYGIACQGDLAVVDADEPDRLRTLLDALPATLWQRSGSRTSEHYFLWVPGLTNDIPIDDPETGENLGHVKGAPQSYVIGPGSRHPSGNRYGPLQGDEVATLSELDLRAALTPWDDPVIAGTRAATRTSLERLYAAERDSDPAEGTPPGSVPAAAIEPYLGARPTRGATDDGGGATAEIDLDVYDVKCVSRGAFPEGAREPHPTHGAKQTDGNFMVDSGAETWRCWRHETTGNALHLIGIEQNVIDCGDWYPHGLDSDTWREIFNAARDAGYDIPDPRRDPDPPADIPDDDRGEAPSEIVRCPTCNGPLPARTAVDGHPGVRWCDYCHIEVTAADWRTGAASVSSSSVRWR